MEKKLPSFLSVILFIVLLAGSSGKIQAQLFVDGSFSPDVMVEDFFSTSCVQVSNIAWVANDTVAQMGFFEGSAANIGLNAGILLTSGTIQNAIGPNNNTSSSLYTNGAGDSDLNDLLGVPGSFTYDACVLEFDLTSLDEDTLYFEYVFGSEEYTEFVGSAFNDAFAFLVSGPGYTPNTNIALIPGSEVPVAINNVNQIDNADYYVNNGDGATAPFNTDSTFVQYDGLTTVMAAPMYVIPGETYHVKLVVADVMDGILDSGVFIGIQSLCGGPELEPISEFAYLVAADGSNTVTFENDSRYATSWTWDFGDGGNSTARNPGPHTYSEAGTYTVRLSISNYCCTSVYTQEITVGDATGINIGKPKMDAVLYPNPVADVLQVQLAVPTAELHIYDTAGQLVLQQTLQNQTSINVSNLQKGLYFVEITSGNSVLRQRILRQ